MWGPLLALGSAVAYGLVDFAGGVLPKRMHFAAVALVGQVSRARPYPGRAPHTWR